MQAWHLLLILSSAATHYTDVRPSLIIMLASCSSYLLSSLRILPALQIRWMIRRLSCIKSGIKAAFICLVLIECLILFCLLFCFWLLFTAFLARPDVTFGHPAVFHLNKNTNSLTVTLPADVLCQCIQSVFPLGSPVNVFSHYFCCCPLSIYSVTIPTSVPHYSYLQPMYSVTISTGVPCHCILSLFLPVSPVNVYSH